MILKRPLTQRPVTEYERKRALFYFCVLVILFVVLKVEKENQPAFKG